MKTKYACPICGSELVDCLYKDIAGDIVGCPDCVTEVDIYDYCDDLEENRAILAAEERGDR